MASDEEANLDALCDLLGDDDDGGGGNDDKEEELRRQMQRMQEQMDSLKRKLEAAESKASSQQEVDVFGKSGKSKDALRSPQKTNPFAEVKVTDKRTKHYGGGERRFGPALPTITPSRRLEGKEKRELVESLRARDAERKDAVAVVAQDLRDSSDDDDRVESAPKCNSFGRDVKRNLVDASRKPKPGFHNVQGPHVNLSDPSANKVLKNVMLESHSQLRISNFLLNQTSLNLSLVGRKMIQMHRLKTSISTKECDGDWVTIGVVFYKSSQTSKNGNNFTVWKMTDLRAGGSGGSSEFATVSVLLFGRANSKHYSMPLNKVVGILNPKVLEDRNGKGEVSLSVDHPDKVLEIGDSADVGKCQAKRADGGGCTSLVNRSSCEYCTHHVKGAYASMSSKRGDLQSSFSGNSDVRDRIMAKVAPKGEVFAGGQVLNANVAVFKGKGSAKQRQKDFQTLSKLGGGGMPTAAESQTLTNNIAKKRQVLHDKLFNDSPGLDVAEKKAINSVASDVSHDLGMKLLNPTPGSRHLIRHYINETLPKSDAKRTQILSREEELKLRRQRMADNQKSAQTLLSQTKQQLKPPVLGRGLVSGNVIDLSRTPSSSSSRQKAVMLLKGKQLKKSDPNYVMKRKRSSGDVARSGKKVCAVMEPESTPPLPEERQKANVVRSFSGQVIDKDRMEELRNKKSLKHQLAEGEEVEQEEMYFNKLEKKEAMEEKMVATREVETRVVSCSACNYTSFSQSEVCRNMGHAVKRLKATKRFFECKNCKKRTFAFDRYPNKTCSNCGGSAWERTGMMRQRKGPLLENETLLIRGQEQAFVESNVKSSQLNLNSLA